MGYDDKVYTRSSSDGITWSSWIGVTATTPTPLITLGQTADRLHQTYIRSDKRIITRVTADGITWSDWYMDDGESGTPVSMSSFGTKFYQYQTGLNGRLYWREKNV